MNQPPAQPDLNFLTVPNLTVLLSFALVCATLYGLRLLQEPTARHALRVSSYSKERHAAFVQWGLPLLSGLILCVFLMRFITATWGYELTVDRNTFSAWALESSRSGVSGLYASGMMVDYPPIALFFLGLEATIASWFQWAPGSTGFSLALNILPVVSDLALGVLLYFVTRRFLTPDKRSSLSYPSTKNPLPQQILGLLICIALSAALPHNFMNGSFYGQVDSLFCVWTLMTFYWMVPTAPENSGSRATSAEKSLLQDSFWSRFFSFQLSLAAVCYALAIMTKPQALLVAPVGGLLGLLLWDWKKILGACAAFVFALILILLLAAGFDTNLLTQILEQYQKTLVQYPYASLNAANLYALLGKNWTSVEQSWIGGLSLNNWGKIFLGCIILATALGFAKIFPRKNRENFLKQPSETFVRACTLSSWSLLLIFCFVDEMHERYLHLSATLMFFGALASCRPFLLSFAGVLTLLSTLNQSLLLEFHAINKGYHIMGGQWALIMLSVLHLVAAFALTVLIFWKPSLLFRSTPIHSIFPLHNLGGAYDESQRTAHSMPATERDALFSVIRQARVSLTLSEPSTDDKSGLTRLAGSRRGPLLLLLLAVLVSTILSFVQLGSLSSPTSFWNPKNHKGPIVFQLQEPVESEKLRLFGFFSLGQGIFRVSVSETEAGPWTPFGELGHRSRFDAFEWREVNIEDTSQSLLPQNVSFFRLESVREVSKTTQVIQEDTAHSSAEGPKERIVTDTNHSLDIHELVVIFEERVIPARALEPDWKNTVDEPESFPLHRLNRRPYTAGMVFDEVYHVRSAYEEIRGIPQSETTHPPLGKTMISWGIKIFGLNTWGWRVVPAVFSVLLTLLFGIFLWSLTRRAWLASGAALLFSLDFMRTAQSRMSTLDIFAVFWVLASATCMVEFMRQWRQAALHEGNKKTATQEDPSQTRLRAAVLLILGGAVFGFGVATKWSVLYVAPALALLFFWTLGSDILAYTSADRHRRPLRRWSMITVISGLSYTALPLAISYLCYHYSRDVTGQATGWPAFWHTQSFMYKYHAELEASHSFSSLWWEWPLIVKPLWAFAGGVTSDGTTQTLATFGNPSIWWAFAPAVLLSIIWAPIRRLTETRIIWILIGSCYLPWIVAPRSLTFIYHFFPVVPFATALWALVLWEAYCRWKQSRKWIAGYFGLCALLLIAFAPVITAWPSSKGYVDSTLRWFQSWYF